MWFRRRYFRLCDISIWFLLIFVISLVVIILPKFFDFSTAAFIGLTLTTISVMLWQTLRESPEVIILPWFTIRGTPDKAGDAVDDEPYDRKSYHRLFVHWFLRWPILRIEEFKPMKRYNFKFDIGNVGLHDITLHEFSLTIVCLSNEKIVGRWPLIDMKGNRTVLHCGERMTLRRVLPIEDNFLNVFRIDVLTIGKEASRWLYVFKKGNKLQYFDVTRNIGLHPKNVERTLLGDSYSEKLKRMLGIETL